VDLLAWVTCLEFFDLTARHEVGTVSNMRESSSAPPRRRRSSPFDRGRVPHLERAGRVGGTRSAASPAASAGRPVVILGERARGRAMNA
jgi:hypothetical protein